MIQFFIRVGAALVIMAATAVDIHGSWGWGFLLWCLGMFLIEMSVEIEKARAVARWRDLLEDTRDAA